MIHESQFNGDSPMARFGHTITPISKQRAILFGGAIGQLGRYVITDHTYICNYQTKTWRKLECRGMSPSNRAAHAAVCYQHYLFVYGGALGGIIETIQGGQLADDKLYQLDFCTINDKAYWGIKNTSGVSPGSRYGHIMAVLDNSIVVHGGNTGSQATGDLWRLNLKDKCVWQKVITQLQCPAPRVYHSASVCETGQAIGMVVIFGGRGTDQTSLNDTWGLRKHRNGRLDWTKAPYKSNNQLPTQRYQHRSMFVGTLLLIIGGRNNEVGQPMPFDVFDTKSSDWYKLECIERFRHACFLIDSYIYILGGFDQQTPNIPTDHIMKIDLNKCFANSPSLFRGLAFQLGREVINHDQKPRTNVNDGRRSQQMGRQRIQYESTNYVQQRNIKTVNNKSIRLCPEAIVANYNQQNDVKKVLIDFLPAEHKRLIGNSQLEDSKQGIDKIYRYFLTPLFNRPLASLNTAIPPEYLEKLVVAVEKIVEKQPTLIRINAPAKVFGDIHGQINEINRFFDSFGSPSDQLPCGDIEYMNYIFLGNYIDRGTKSLQTLLLLFSLKIKYPQQIILLRGSHEDRQINRSMGLGDQCASKLKENIDDPNSFYNKFNRIFQKLPLAALLQNQLLCVHSGIGTIIKQYTEIQQLQRPIKINHNPKTKEQSIVYELLWSNPCRNNQGENLYEFNYFKNKNIPKYSQNRSNIFCDENDLIGIIRGHQPIVKGVQAKQSIVTVYSCSDYGNSGNKAGIVQVLKKNCTIAPKILTPTAGKDRWYNLQDLNSIKDNHEEVALRKLAFTPPKKV